MSYRGEGDWVSGLWGIGCIIFVIVSIIIGSDAPELNTAIVIGAIAAIIFAFKFGGKIIEACSRCKHGVLKSELFGQCEDCEEERVAHAKAHKKYKKEQKRVSKLVEKGELLREKEIKRLIDNLPLSSKNLRKLSPYEFEEVVATIFRRHGFKVKTTKRSGDMGRDAIMYKDNEKYLLECKKYAKTTTVGRPDIQKFHSAMIHDEADYGIFVNLGRFTNEAEEYAEAVGVTILDGADLISMVGNSSSKNAGANYKCICTNCGSKNTQNVYEATGVICQCGDEIEPVIVPANVFQF
jgi:HJR/Mrr/RecB family endonuclease